MKSKRTLYQAYLERNPGIGVDGFFQGGPVLDKVPESLVDRPPKPQRLRVIGSFRIKQFEQIKGLLQTRSFIRLILLLL